MNQFCIFIALFLILLCTPASEAQSTTNTKVVVSTFDEFTDITEHVPNFDSFNDLAQFISQDLSANIELKQQVLNAFLANTPKLNPQQLTLFYWFKSQISFQLKQYDKVLQQLNLIDLELITAEQRLQLFFYQARSLEQTHQLFQASQVFESAYQQALKLRNNKLANRASLALAALYLELGKDTQVSYWLAQVNSKLDSNSDLAAALETAVELASLQAKLAQTEQAEQTLNHTIAYLTERKLGGLSISLELQLAELYRDSYQIEKAQQLYQQLFQQGKTNRDTSLQLQALTGLMQLALTTGSPWQANELLQQANKIQAKVTKLTSKLPFIDIKAKINAARGNYQQALALSHQYGKLAGDSLSLLERQNLTKQQLTWLAKIGRVQNFEHNFALYKGQTQQLAETAKLRQVNYFSQLQQQQSQQLAQLNQAKAADNEGYQHHLSALKAQIERLYWALLLLLIAGGIGAYWWYKKRNFEQAQQSFVDPVSKAYNHSFLTKKVLQLKASGQGFALVKFDLDGFTEHNLALGYKGADRLLAQMVSRLQARIKVNTWLIRLSADQFILVANNFSSNQAFVLAEILRKELNSKQFRINKRKVTLSASFSSLVVAPRVELDAAKAQLAHGVAQAKAQGGNCTVSQDQASALDNNNNKGMKQ